MLKSALLEIEIETSGGCCVGSWAADEHPALWRITGVFTYFFSLLSSGSLDTISSTLHVFFPVISFFSEVDSSFSIAHAEVIIALGGV
jgi:hypothetical protein